MKSATNNIVNMDLKINGLSAKAFYTRSFHYFSIGFKIFIYQENMNLEHPLLPCFLIFITYCAISLRVNDWEQKQVAHACVLMHLTDLNCQAIGKAHEQTKFYPCATGTRINAGP